MVSKVYDRHFLFGYSLNDVGEHMQTYQAIYCTPVNHIAVPKQFRMGNFEVSFKEIPAENNAK